MITRNTIKAIPETYKGVQFRSKMEARFAKWCDKHRQKWLYEQEGLTNGEQAYLPDFYLPDSKMIVEIKPVFFLGEAYKLDMLLNNEAFDKFSLVVIEMAQDINVIKYSPPEYDFNEDGDQERYWVDPVYFSCVGWCRKCRALNIETYKSSDKCTGCGHYDEQFGIDGFIY